MNSTIIAPATTPGTGAISTIRISGPEAFRIVDAVVQLKKGTVEASRGYTIHYGEIPDVDDVLVSVFRAPNSYTGENCVEINCHASSWIATEILRRLSEAGAEYAAPGEFTSRAFLNGKMDLAQAEAVADIISSTTSASHRVALNQLRGGYSKEFDGIEAKLLEVAALLELELDFSEEDVEFTSRENLLSLLEEALTKVNKLINSYKSGNAIKRGVPVAIVGAVNAGKSTLLNAILKDDRAIVSDVPGTTRDTVEEVLNLGGISFRFIDTAGLRNTSDLVENIGIGRSLKKLSEAEIILVVADPSGSEEALSESLEQISSSLSNEQQLLVFLINKIDFAGENEVNKFVIIINNFVSSLKNKSFIINVSAKQEIGIDKLIELLIEAKKDLLSPSDEAIVTSERHLAALRETASALEKVRSSLRSGATTDLLAEDLRHATSTLGTVTGHTLLPDTILGTIFSRFCVGK